MKFKHLHDATLVAIHISWETGEVNVDLKTPDGLTVIRGREARKLECPRYFPWGRSVSVNEVREGPHGELDEIHRLEIEMQSGDVIEVVAKDFSLNAKDMTSPN
jgi:hypothetical protein